MKDRFKFGSTNVEIRQGNIMDPGVKLDAIASPDDNYISMGAGLAGRLAKQAATEEHPTAYRRAAAIQGPIPLGGAIHTEPYGLHDKLGISFVIHAAAIDYDGMRVPLEESVNRATTSCLRLAERLGARRLMLPAFGTGAGGLEMSSAGAAMSRAIKAFLALDRELDYVGIILYRPNPEGADPEALRDTVAGNEDFLRAANLVLGTPYDPALTEPQIRDSHARESELAQVLDVLASDELRHVAILGGPRMGKTALLSQVMHARREAEAGTGQRPRLVPVSFGQLHENTPGSFIYRKMLLALAEDEPDEDHVAKIKSLYSDPGMTSGHLADFLEAPEHAERYSRVVFVIDDLPRLLAMDPRDPARPQPEFWADLADLERLGSRIRVLFTATDDESYEEVRRRLDPGFTSLLTEVRLGPISDEGRREWTRAALDRYLHRKPSEEERELFLEELVKPEGGGQPFLISLVLHTVVRKLNADALGAGGPPEAYDEHLVHDLRSDLEKATAESDVESELSQYAVKKAQFFDDLLKRVRDHEALEMLAQRTGLPAERAALMNRIAQDPSAIERFAEVDRRMQELPGLLRGRLEPLARLGCVVGAEDTATAEFVAPSVERYLHEYFGVGVAREPSSERVKLEIMLTRLDANNIRVQLSGQGAHVFSTPKKLEKGDEDRFKANFAGFLRGEGEFRSIDDIGREILINLVSGAVKSHLIGAAHKQTTIDFVVGEELEHIPWELIVETVYTDQLPFRMGRRVIRKGEPAALAVVQRGNGTIPALLIGNPTGDLPGANEEIEAIAERLAADGRFSLKILGPESLKERLQNNERLRRLELAVEDPKRTNLIRALDEHRPALVHYSGHSGHLGERSAWRLQDEDMRTDQLTNVLQVAPPALIFSSSCESGMSAAEKASRAMEYENQTFDLPGAVIQAGVETFIGTLWKVVDSSACAFAVRFYRELLRGSESLGECIRRAKNELREVEGEEGMPTWPAYVLYGDPDLTPLQVYPRLGGKGSGNG